MKHKFKVRLKALKMEIAEHKSSFIVYLVLRALVILVMILQILSYGVYSNVDSSLRAAVTKTNSYLEMEMLKREFFLTSDVDQNNTATIYQEYDSKAYR